MEVFMGTETFSEILQLTKSSKTSQIGSTWKLIHQAFNPDILEKIIDIECVLLINIYFHITVRFPMRMLSILLKVCKQKRQPLLWIYSENQHKASIKSK